MIHAFLHGLESAFAWLVEASWQASVLVVLVLLLQVLLRSRLNPRWHHALWLLVVARLILPALPESALSVFQFTPHPPSAIAETVTEPLFAPSTQIQAPAPSLPAPPLAPAYPFSLCTLLALAWLAGASGLLLLTWQVNRRFARHVAQAPAVSDPRLIELADAARSELGLHRWPRLIESAQVQSPAIMGLFRPTLILPKDVRARFSDAELRFIFLHEFAHLKRGDLFLQWLIALLQILHWFNPVLWYAFRRMRIDREPATDALVLSRTGEEQKESYGHVLLKLLEHYHTRHSLPTLVGILEDKDQFKRRFSLIAKFTRGAYGWSLLGVLLIAALGAICLTKAKAQDTAPKAEKYLETTFVETPGAMNGAGSGPRRPVDLLQMLRDPKNNVSVLADVVLKDGPILLKGKTPATFDYTITGDWKNSITEPQKIDIRIDDHSIPGLQHSWETKESLSQGQPVVVFQSWKSTSHANLLIRIVDHPGSVNSATDTANQSHDTSADPTIIPTNGTLAQIVLALKDNAQAIPSDHQRLQILRGFYGADGSWRDVTGILQKSIQNNSLKVSWQQPYAEIGGDPAYLQVKTLIVSYRLDGVEKLATFREENPPVGLQALIPIKNEGKSSDPNAQMLEAADKGTPKTSTEIQTPTNRATAVNLTGAVTLQQAIDWDRDDFAKSLLDSGTKASQSDFIYALKASRPKIVSLIWYHGVHGCSPMSFAISQGASSTEVEAILNTGAKVQPDEDFELSPLCVACAFGNSPAAHTLLAHGADPNWIGKSREAISSPLWLAIGGRQPEIVRLLLDHGALPEGQDVTVALGDLSADMKARAPDVYYQKASDCFRILVAHGALEKVPAHMKASVLSNACLQVQDLDIVKELLAHGFHPADEDAVGETSLSRVHDAVEGRNNWPASPQFKPFLDLLEAAAKSAPKSDTGTQRPDVNSTFVEPGLNPVDSTEIPKSNGATVSGWLKVPEAAHPDFANSSGVLMSDGKKDYPFSLDSDGKFVISDVAPGNYRQLIHLAWLRNSVHTTSEGDFGIVAIGTSNHTTNFSWDPDTAVPLKGTIQIGLKVIQIDENAYQSERAKIDSAVAAGDAAALVTTINQMKGASLLTIPGVATTPGTKANIDILQEMPYPTSFENPKFLHNVVSAGPGGQSHFDAYVPPTPREFATKDVGISAEITPMLVAEGVSPQGSIILNGKFTVTRFEGFTQSNFVGTGTPSFSTSESLFVEALKDGGSKAIWIPGAHFREDANEVPIAVISATTNASVVRTRLAVTSATTGDSVIRTRLLLVMTVNLVKN